MDDYNGFRGNGNWYKGNIQSHTTVSDGMLEPEEAVNKYRDHGFSFLALSDHDIFTDFRERFDTEDFITIPATEASVNLFTREGSVDRYKVHHLLGLMGTKEMQDAAPDGVYKHLQSIPPLQLYGEWDGQEVAQQTADMLMRHGCVTTYNHPGWSRVTEEDFIHTEGLSALEIFNFNTVWESNTGFDCGSWDRMLRMGRKINGFASDDNHNEGLFEDSCGGWICVNAPDLSHDSIIQNFIDGNYYSSSGPEIYNWGVKDGKVWADTSSVNRVNFICGNYINDGWMTFDSWYEDTITHAEYTLKGHETYVRVEATDKFGRTACQNQSTLDKETV